MSFEKKKIFLIRANLENTIKIFNSKHTNDLNYWIYLGKNAKLFSEIEKIIGDRIKKVEFGKSLQETAHTLRKPYIDFIGSISHKKDKFSWILSSISEKNVFLSDLFLMLCQLETLENEIKKYLGGICVFCEDPTLFRNIRKNFGEKKYLEVIVIQDLDPTTKSIPNLVKQKFKFIRNKVLFFNYFAKKIFFTKILKIRSISGENIPTNKPVIAIHTWTDQRSFVIEGSFSDPYFGNLEHILEKNNNNSFYVINILSTISYTKALKKLLKIKSNWKLFEEFLEFSDIIRALYMVHGRKTDKTKEIFFVGHEISDLLNKEYTNDRYNNRSETCALYYFAARRMAKQFSIKTYIYPFENHIWERMAIEGFRKTSSQTKIVGYAHAIVDKMYLPYSLSEAEIFLIPIPDIILVNGPMAKENLLKSGFKYADIRIIGSLRYGNLTFNDKRKKIGSKYKIILVLSVDLDRSLEMIIKCTNAFKNLEDLSIIIKPHPIMNLECLIKSVGNLPKIFSISSESLITILFETADLVMYCDSTAAVEAASLGIPLLHIKSDFNIDINIFEDVNIIPSVSSPQEIRNQSLKILNGEYPAFEEIHMYVEQIFSRVDEQKILEIL